MSEPITPTSDNTDKRAFEISGRVANSLTNDPIKGADVTMTTSVGSYQIKTREGGYFDLSIIIEVIPTPRTVTSPFRFIQNDIIGEKDEVVYDEVRDKSSIIYTIQYLFNDKQYVGVGRAFLISESKFDKKNSKAFAAKSALGDIQDQIIEEYGELPDFEEVLYDGYEVNESPPLDINKSGFTPYSCSPYKQDKTVKTYIGLKKLVSEKKQTEKDVAASGTLDPKTTKQINKGGSKPLPTPQKVILKQVDNLSNKLLPFIIGMLAAFGITKIKDWLDGKRNFDNTKTTCPSRAKLNQQIKKRNRIVKQLNNIYKIISTAVKAIGIALALLKIFQLILNIFKVLPIPSTIGIPPGPAGGVILSASYGKLIRNQEKFDKISLKLKMFAKIGGIILTALILLRGLLAAALQLLGLLDQKMQACAEQYANDDDGSGINETQIALSAELVALSKQQAEEDNSPVTDLVNGFKMGVETDPKYKVGTLDRRRATATNSQGVVMLRGEPSFSATDQILIDELAFYITSNNLKA